MPTDKTNILVPSPTYQEFWCHWLAMVHHCWLHGVADTLCRGPYLMVLWQPEPGQFAMPPTKMCWHHFDTYDYHHQRFPYHAELLVVLDTEAAGAMAYAMMVNDYRMALRRYPLTLWECPNCGMPYAYETRCMMPSCKGAKVWMSVDVVASRSTMTTRSGRGVVRPARRPKAKA